jgi:hypothetical protein
MHRNRNGEPVLHKETVRVYRNLRDGCWSIQRKIPGKGWRVWLRWDYVVLDDAQFVVNKSGQDRVRRENKKYVHAFCYGTLMANTLGCNKKMIRVNYNPYNNDQFQTQHGDVHEANRVWLTHKGEVFCE